MQTDSRVPLPYRPPYDWDALTAFLAPRALGGIERVVDGCYRRRVAHDGVSGVIVVRHVPSEDRLDLSIPQSLRDHSASIVSRARRLFDLDADPRAIAANLGRHARLRPLVEARPGLRVPGAWDVFETSIRVILGQQISVAGASTLARRLVRDFGTVVAPGCDLGRRFPDPISLVDARIRSIGLTARRTETIQTFSAAVHRRELRFEYSGGLEAVVAELTRLRGIGPWTAHVIAMRALGERDAFPHGDLGIVKALSPPDARIGATAILNMAEQFRPHRAYAAAHLWQELADRA